MLAQTETLDPNLALVAPLVLTFLVTLITVGGQMWSSRQARLTEKLKIELLQEGDTTKWLREQKASAYVSIIDYLYRSDWSPEATAPIMARVYAFGSREVVAALDHWKNSEDPPEEQSGDWKRLVGAINDELGVGLLPTKRWVLRD